MNVARMNHACIKFSEGGKNKVMVVGGVTESAAEEFRCFSNFITAIYTMVQCDEGGGHPGHVHPDLEEGDGATRGGDGHKPYPGQREAGCGGPLRQGEPEEDPPIQGKWWVVDVLCSALKKMLQSFFPDSWENVPAQLVEGRSDYQIVRGIPKTVR